jgi:two-component system OmpR family response regulator
MPSDTNHRLGKRSVTGGEDGSAMTSAAVLDLRSVPSPFVRTTNFPADVSAANVVAVAELLARVEDLLRPPAIGRETMLNVGPLQLDLLTRIVKRDERKLDLRPREFCLLEYMMRRKGQVLTRAMLFSEVWNYKFNPQSNLVDVHMGRLRHKIDGPCEPPMIYNVRGQGFVLREPY